MYNNGQNDISIVYNATLNSFLRIGLRQGFSEQSLHNIFKGFINAERLYQTFCMFVNQNPNWSQDSIIERLASDAFENYMENQQNRGLNNQIGGHHNILNQGNFNGGINQNYSRCDDTPNTNQMHQQPTMQYQQNVQNNHQQPIMQKNDLEKFTLVSRTEMKLEKPKTKNITLVDSDSYLLEDNSSSVIILNYEMEKEFDGSISESLRILYNSLPTRIKNLLEEGNGSDRFLARLKYKSYQKINMGYKDLEKFLKFVGERFENIAEFKEAFDEYTRSITVKNLKISNDLFSEAISKKLPLLINGRKATDVDLEGIVEILDMIKAHEEEDFFVSIIRPTLNQLKNMDVVDSENFELLKEKEFIPKDAEVLGINGPEFFKENSVYVVEKNVGITTITRGHIPEDKKDREKYFGSCSLSRSDENDYWKNFNLDAVVFPSDSNPITEQSLDIMSMSIFPGNKKISIKKKSTFGWI